MEAANPIHEFSYAASRDEKDVLRLFRSEFLIPTKADLRRKTLARPENASSEEESIYLCGNSLGLQPKQTAKLISDYLTSWSTKAVTGHFIGHVDAPHIPPYLHVDDFAAELMAPIVGAKKEEVACMGTLTANLHLMMSSFYKPEPKGSDGQLQGRYKIILEGKAFPSDHVRTHSTISIAQDRLHCCIYGLHAETRSSPVCYRIPNTLPWIYTLRCHDHDQPQTRAVHHRTRTDYLHH